MKNDADRGFTLIELLIVVALLAILTTILIRIRDVNMRQQRSIADFQKAAWIMQSQAERVRATPFEALKAGTKHDYGAEQFRAMALPSGGGTAMPLSRTASLRGIEYWRTPLLTFPAAPRA